MANCSDSLRGHAAIRLGHFALLARGYMFFQDSILSDRKPANAEEPIMADESKEQRLRAEHDQLMVEFDDLHPRLGAIERRYFRSLMEFVSVDERIAIAADHKKYGEDWRAWQQRRDAWQQKWDNRNQ